MKQRDQRGSAIADFVMVLVVLLPIILGIMHFALVAHVRNTLINAASEGARYGATYGHGPEDATARTREAVHGALSARYAQNIGARYDTEGGLNMMEVNIHVVVPALGVMGPATALDVSGHAIVEPGQ